MAPNCSPTIACGRLISDYRTVGWAGAVLNTVWEMTRMLLKTLGVVVLLILAMVLLIGALLASAG